MINTITITNNDFFTAINASYARTKLNPETRKKERKFRLKLHQAVKLVSGLLLSDKEKAQYQANYNKLVG